MGSFLFIVYVAVGYWAVGETFLGTPLGGRYDNLLVQKMLCAILLGWIVIPIVLLKYITKGRR